ATIAALAEMERIPRGELVVAANEGTCLHVLPEVFAEFKRAYPTVAVSIQRSEYARIIETVLDNSVDFGVVTLPVPDKRFEAVLIHRDDLVLITPAGHPLAASARKSRTPLSSPTLAEVAQHPLVMPKFGRTRDALEALFHARSLKLNIAMELDSSEL